MRSRLSAAGRGVAASLLCAFAAGAVAADPASARGSMTVAGERIPTLKVADGRVAGSIERAMAGEPPTQVAVTFSAPVQHEPKVTEDLRGGAAQSSAQVKTLVSAAKALAQGDRAAQGAHMTAGARERQDRTFAQPGMPKGPALAKMLKQAGDEMTKELAKAQRVVVRGQRAVVLLASGTVRSMALENGAWKIDE